MTVILNRTHGGGAYLVLADLAGVIDPPPPVDPGPGDTSSTLSSSTVFDTFRVFNRDVYTGRPAGFPSSLNKGYGAVPILITPSQAVTGGVWARFHDALNSSTNLNVPGTGPITYGPLPLPGVTGLHTGVNAINMDVPAALAWLAVDIALDAAMSNPIRIPRVFGVGANFGVGPGTSHSGMMLGSYAYDATACTMIESLVPDISPYGVCFDPNPVNAMAAGVPLPADHQTTWKKPGNYPASPYHSTFPAEFLKLATAQLGMVCALIGHGTSGGFSRDWKAPYDVVNTGHQYGALIQAMTHTNKWEVQLGLLGANDSETPNGAHFTRAQTVKNLMAVYTDLAARNAVPNMGVVLASSPITDFGNGSDAPRQQQLAQRDMEQLLPNALNNPYTNHGVGNLSGHTTMLDRIPISHGYFRLAMALMGPAKGGLPRRKGPRFSKVATRVGTEITLKVIHDGPATALIKWGITDGPNTSTVRTVPAISTQSDTLALAWLFSVMPAGFTKPYNTLSDGVASVLALASGTKVQVVDFETIKLYLAADPGDSTPLNAYYGMDFNASAGFDPANPSTACYLYDDVTDSAAIGIPYGWPLQRTIEPIYIAPPVPATQKVFFGSMFPPVPGGWLYANGTGTGLTLDRDLGVDSLSNTIEVSINGGSTYAVPTGLRVQDNNDWGGLIKIPSTTAVGAVLSLAVRRVGQSSAPDDTDTITVVSPRTELPDPDGTGNLRSALIVNYDVMNAGSMWQDLAQTIPPDHTQPIRVWKDGLGNAANTITYTRGTLGFPPWLDMHKQAKSSRSVRLKRPYMHFGQNYGSDRASSSRLDNTACAFAAQMGGDFTIMVIADSLGVNWMNITTTGSPAWNWGPEIVGTSSGGAGLPALRRRSGGLSTNGTGLLTLNTTNLPPVRYAVDYIFLSYDNSTGTLLLENRSNLPVSTTDPNKPLLTTLNTFYLGGTVEGNGYADMRIHQWLAFNRVLTTAEKTALTGNSFAGAKWPW